MPGAAEVGIPPALAAGPVIVADDYGLGAGHDATIRSLLARRAISATSVLVHDALEGDRVTGLLAAAKAGGGWIGLHLNLTLALPGIQALGDVRHLLARALRPGGLGHELLARASACLAWQFARFEALFGRPPDFADGHEHVIAIPGISAALVDLLARRPRAPGFWVRSPSPASVSGLLDELRAGGAKALVIAAMGADLRRRLRAAGIPTNRDFTGIVRLDRPDGLARQLPAIRNRARPGCVVMVHPGDPHDPVQVPGHLPLARGEEARLLATAGLEAFGARHG